MTATKRHGILTGGTWCVDFNKVVSFWPQEDTLAEYKEEEKEGGGSGHNLAMAIRRLDPNFLVETITLVGDDDNGQFLINLAEESGVSSNNMVVLPGVPTQFTDAFCSEASRRRTHIFKRGTADYLSPDHFDFSQTTARYLHLGLPGVHAIMDSSFAGNENGWVAVLKKARRAGLKTNLEVITIAAERMRELCIPCLPHLDLLVVNDSEIGSITGISTFDADGKTNPAACIEAAKNALEKGAMESVAVHFPTGALAVHRDGTIAYHPSVMIPQELVVGSNGAGDAFAAGYLYGIHESWSLEQSLALGHASAASSLRSLSTTRSIETWQNCLAKANEWGWRSA